MTVDMGYLIECKLFQAVPVDRTCCLNDTSRQGSQWGPKGWLECHSC